MLGCQEPETKSGREPLSGSSLSRDVAKPSCYGESVFVTQWFTNKTCHLEA